MWSTAVAPVAPVHVRRRLFHALRGTVSTLVPNPIRYWSSGARARSPSIPHPSSLTIDVGKKGLSGMQASTSAQNFKSGGWTNQLRFKGQEGGESPSRIRHGYESDHRPQKCIPGSPRCVRCTNMGIEDCVYNKIRKRGAGNTLGTGEACGYCR